MLLDHKQDKAAFWYLKAAAEHGDADGEFYLGRMYAENRGVPKPDQSRATDLLLQAAKHGHPEALQVLANTPDFQQRVENYRAGKKYDRIIFGH